MMRQHCDCCDAVISPDQLGFRRLVTIGRGYNISVDVIVMRGGTGEAFCDNCLEAAAEKFVERALVRVAVS